MKRNIKLLLISLLLVLAFFFTFKRNNNEINNDYIEYHFKNETLLMEHYNKHGKDMGYKNAVEYEKAASDVINNEASLHKLEKEDNDDVYYLEDTNEFVILSTKGYIRTYFYPDAGKKYFDKQ